MHNQIIDYCAAKMGVREDYPFGPSPLVMKVGGKMFALISISEESGYTHISLKCDPVIAENLREEHAAVQPGYHLNKKHWNTVIVDGTLTITDLQDMIDHSYHLVLGSLTKAQRYDIESEEAASIKTAAGTSE